MNYELTPNWDTDLQIVFTLGNVTARALRGLVYQAVKRTTGTPAIVAGKYIPGAIVQNVASGIVYRNSGTTAVPAWTAM